MTTTTAAGVELPRPGWRDRAACRDTNPNRWYLSGGKTGSNQQRAVKPWHVGICTQCPVFADCAADALDQRDTYVIRAATALTGHVAGRRALCRVLHALGAKRDDS